MPRIHYHAIRSNHAGTGRGWLAAPDPTLTAFGSGGARHLSTVRAAIFAGLFATAVGFQMTTIEPLTPIVTTGAGVGLAVSLFVAWRVRTGTTLPAGLAFATSTIDVSLVSGILVSFAVSGRTSVATHSLFVWELYLLAIVVSALHFDLRVVLFAGAMALAQWAVVLAWVTANWGLTTQVLDPRHDALVQVLRFVLIGVFTVGTGLIVLRTSRLVRLSGTDALTGLANRALLDQRLVEEVAAARRWGRPLSVAFLDIDRFKLFNDRWGHGAGDEALRTTARALIAESRESDVIARWGGEELVLVLPDSLGKDAAMAVERIRGRLAITPIPGVSPDARVTLSAGIAEFPVDGDDASTLEQVADRRLMMAKRRGRDCVVARG